MGHVTSAGQCDSTAIGRMMHNEAQQHSEDMTTHGASYDECS